MNPTNNELTIRFDNVAMAKHFKAWLDGQGEQDYWTWMEVQESPDGTPIEARSFNYHEGPNLIVGTAE